MENDNAKFKNWIKENWWKAFLIIWLIYGISKLDSADIFKGVMFEIVFFAVIAFVAGYGLGKNSK